jgi:HD-GYP domain-containing protein (c-di-GMP phosphodiesterase class II)
MSRHRIEAGDLQVGMPLPFDVFDSDDRLLLSRGNRITSEAQLKRLVREGVYYHAATRVQDAGADDAIQPASDEKTKPARVAREVSTFEILDDCSRRLAALLDGVTSPSGTGSLALEVKVLLTQVQRCCLFDSDASLAYVLLGHAARHTVRQQLNVAILTALMLSRMTPGSVRTEAALAAALTMNVGALALHDELYWLSTPLGEDQRAALRQHPNASVQALRDRGVDDLAWLEIVAQHHEGLDGSGYPLGIRGAAICREAQVVGVADRYNGMVMDRGYRHGLSPDFALKELARREANTLDPALVGLLIQVMGVYPPGTVVALVNREVGVVTKRLLDLNHPIVRTFFIDPFWPYAKPLKRFTAQMPQFAIAKVLSRDALDYAIDPEQLWPPDHFAESEHERPDDADV